MTNTTKPKEIQALVSAVLALQEQIEELQKKVEILESERGARVKYPKIL